MQPPARPCEALGPQFRHPQIADFMATLTFFSLPNSIWKLQKSDPEVEHSLERQLYEGGTMALAREELKYLNHLHPVGRIPSHPDPH